ncbi:MAG: anhydro-N-acetylmuramic acid kinase [Bacteroidetes bacterium]|nr:anhydro-N-acetylmuramic acid kinase [Bacteroidota bacterium]
MKPNLYYIVGLMSGTSLDGLDIAHCRFELVNNSWHYHILQAETIPYSDSWQERLARIDLANAEEFARTDSDAGYLFGKLTREFINKHQLEPDFIASHGQTIFHQPESGFTTQIGKGAAIAAATGIPVVCDFRSTDVAWGGQGAPLVPIGDKLLFPDYDYCLNLGGIANISYDKDGVRIAYDICPVNMALNTLAKKMNLPYDRDGKLASEGTIRPQLLDQLNQLPYYHQQPPKSLGKEWVELNITPLLAPLIRDPEPEQSGVRRSQSGIRDLLHTFCEHIAIQIKKNSGDDRVKKLLITGGGALNEYLIERIRNHASPQVIIPDLQTIQFKEALIFAFLGLLRWRNEVNCLASVTGAKKDTIGGAIYL